MARGYGSGRRRRGTVPGVRRGRLLVTILVVLLVVVVGLVVVTLALRRSETRDFETAEQVDVVEIHLESGDVRVDATEQDRIRVRQTRRWSWRAPQLEQAVEDGRLRLTADCPGLSLGCSVNHRLAVPPSVAVVITTDRGSITVAGLRGDTTARTSAGSVEVSSVAGSVDVETDAGNVNAVNLTSPRLKATTDAGSIEATFRSAPDDVRVESDAGGIRLTVPDDLYSVKTDTNTGRPDVDVRLDPDARRRIDARTNAGGITIRRL
jgi:hypothetical protein